MANAGLAGVRLRGVDWFAWSTGGSRNHVLLSAEEGVAEAVIMREHAFILTDAIEAPRFRDEEVPPGFTLREHPWLAPEERDAWVRELTAEGLVASDHPRHKEEVLPPNLILEKWRLGADERERYHLVGRHAAEAMSAALMAARPDWTEEELAAAGAKALWSKGLLPDLILVAGEARFARYRHPLPTGARLGSRAMMVFCARRHGLYANLTRIVSFREPSREEKRALDVVAAVEEAAFKGSRPGTMLSQVFRDMSTVYQDQGHADEMTFHHQGGVTGYRPRELIATPRTQHVIQEGMALAWNPSLPGMKIEDTVLVNGSGLEVLTHDPHWPSFTRGAFTRPAVLVRP